MKQCTKCKNFREIEQFDRNKARPDGHTSICKICMSEYEVRRRGNPERLAYEKKRSAERYANLTPEEKEKRRAKGREYDRRMWQDPEFRAKKKAKDKLRIRVVSAEQKKRNYQSRKKMFKNDPSKREAYRMRDKIGLHNRNAKRLGLEYGLTIEEWNEIVASQSSECFYCGNFVPIPEIEHKTPMGRGGGNIKSNVTVACPSCNSRKQKRTAEEFIAEMRENPGQYFYAKRIR